MDFFTSSEFATHLTIFLPPQSSPPPPTHPPSHERNNPISAASSGRPPHPINRSRRGIVHLTPVHFGGLDLRLHCTRILASLIHHSRNARRHHIRRARLTTGCECTSDLSAAECQWFRCGYIFGCLHSSGRHLQRAQSRTVNRMWGFATASALVLACWVRTRFATAPFLRCILLLRCKEMDP